MKYIVTIFCTLKLLTNFLFAQIPTNGLVAYYPLNGNADDATGNGNNGTAYGPIPIFDRFDNQNSAYFFNGVDDSITVSNSSSLNISSDITAAVWVKYTSVQNADIVGKYIYPNDNSDAGWDISTNPIDPGKLNFGGRDRSGTYWKAVSHLSWADNRWHFIVGQRQGNRWRLYVDGILDSEEIATSAGDISNTEPLLIGRQIGTSAFFNGSIDDIRIYDRALSDAEIQALYHEGRYNTSPVAYYPFNGNANDESGNGNNGIVYGATLTSDRFDITNSAYSFDGNNNWISIASSPSLIFSNVITIESWINFSEGGVSNPRIISKASKTSNGNVFDVATEGTSSTRKALFAINTGDSTDERALYSKSDLLAGVWYNIGAKYDGLTMAIYVNGILDTTLRVSVPIHNSTGDINIGRNAGDGSDQFSGVIDDIFIYSRALSDSEIQTLYRENEWAKSLVAYYPFTNGSLTDFSGHGNDGIPTGSPPMVPDRFLKSNDALNFSGGNKYITVPSISPSNYTDSLSISAWIYSNGANPSDNQTILGKWGLNAPDQSFTLDFGQANTRAIFSARLSEVSTPPQVWSKQDILPNEWVYLVATYDGDSMKIYINGKIDSSISAPGKIDTTTTAIIIGSHGTTDSNYFNGYIDDIRIYKRSLSQGEIDSLYHVDGWPIHLILAIAGPNGSINPNDSVIVSDSASQEFLITPYTGYHVDSVIVDGVKVDSTTSYTFRNVTSYHSIRAVFALPGTIFGAVVNDQNDDGKRDSVEVTLSGWTIKLTGTLNLQTITDSNGTYRFSNLPDGSYMVGEIQQNQWLQTFPAGAGTYNLIIKNGDTLNGIDFGNITGFQYIGVTGGHWSVDTNWLGLHPPTSHDPVIIPPNTLVVVDSLPNDSVQALRIECGGHLQFTPQIGRLRSLHTIQIDSGASMDFPMDSDTTGLFCEKDWLNRGHINPGHSIITFTGNNPKVIIGQTTNNQFYTLEIAGDSTSTLGEFVVKNTLRLRKSLALRYSDTLVIDTGNSNAIVDTGRIIAGTVKRKILQGETNAYRYESPLTTVTFNGTGTYPSYLSLTTLPDTTPPNFNLRWQVVPSHIDTLANTITADSVGHFSRWVLAVPHVYGPVSIGIAREYNIKTENGDHFLAQLTLRYDQREVPPALNESSLKLLQGPFIDDSVNTGWNMLSLPLIPDSTAKDVVFPGANSDAFDYNGSYSSKDNLLTGEGYWLRFPSPRLISIKGDDFAADTVLASTGWNLIGNVSYPVPIINITSDPPGLVISSYFGYLNGYSRTDTLMPMHAYWVKVSGSGRLILTSTAVKNAGTLKVKADDLLANFNTLEIGDAKGSHVLLYFGTSPSNLDINKFDMPPLPPDGVFDARYATGGMVAINRSNAGEEILITLTSAQYPVIFSWTCKQKAGNTILKIGKEKWISLSGKGSITVTNSTDQIHLYLSPFRIGDELPREFALAQNYPNPFNPTTTIQYQLPSESRVSLKIYNLLGQIVSTLVNQTEQAGYKQVNWNASSFSSGIYFYQLEATSVANPSKTFTKVNKMILIK